MAPEEGNNENKRKYEVNEKENANKRSYDPTTSSGTAQDKQEQGQRNWIKYCNTENKKKFPQCTKCEEKYYFCIDSTPFEAHLNTHSENYIIKDTLEWVFTYFDTVPHKHYLKCGKCDYTHEVQFQGPFVDHFNEEHNQIDIGEPNQGSYQDEEETVYNRTSELIDYLFYEYINRMNTDAQIQAVQEHVKQKTWWRNYMNTDINNTNMRNTIICDLCEEPVHVSINSIDYSIHMDSFHKKKKVKAGNTWLTKYFIFVHDTIICTLCNTLLSLPLNDEFGPHLTERHNKTSVNEPTVDDKTKNYFLQKFLTTLLK